MTLSGQAILTLVGLRLMGCKENQDFVYFWFPDFLLVCFILVIHVALLANIEYLNLDTLIHMQIGKHIPAWERPYCYSYVYFFLRIFKGFYPPL